MRTGPLAALSVALVTTSLAISLVGCGSGGHGSGTDIDGRPIVAGASPFTGRWSGTWLDGALFHSGLMNFVVSANGKVNLTLFNQTLGSSGKGSGRLTGDGRFKGTYRWAGGLKFNASGHFTLTGDRLKGEFELSFKRLHVSLGVIELVRQG